MTMTNSPVSTWGVYSGRCLPRRILAICTASRPTTLSVASITNQRCWIAPFFAINVDITAFQISGPGQQEVVMIKGSHRASRGEKSFHGFRRFPFFLNQAIGPGLVFCGEGRDARLVVAEKVL